MIFNKSYLKYHCVVGVVSVLVMRGGLGLMSFWLRG